MGPEDTVPPAIVNTIGLLGMDASVLGEDIAGKEFDVVRFDELPARGVNRIEVKGKRAEVSVKGNCPRTSP